MDSRTIAPRKEAKQKRSKAKLELILDTTIAMLAEGPADKITTNEIARKAGVPVGTLYQFFPKKEAIFYELFRRWLQHTLEILDSVDADFDGSEPADQLIDAIFDRLSQGAEINSTGHWQLRRAMGSSRELAVLEAEHQNQILMRLIALQQKFGKTIPPEDAFALAGLQNQVSIACLLSMARAGDGAQRAKTRKWCRKTMRLVFDIEQLEA